ncbi:HNH endonuclease [Gordonia phage Syleon]|uniref:HNH endonuclease n=3 Tax=Octobienvirus TaxID=3044779 RepID=A0AAE8Y6E5_9CAUD|nr:HNH endonuclease [Gordonia Phage Sephiroth]YP_010246641.1 HNH endonuclease [Gordonia phage Kudefre]YP_010246781.1 HNH endonuclease [Gordonia phage Syleon]QGH75851.1 HNH endonuclease [Gordonia phage Syleon]QNN99457.1 HNH endonuclease [Gordonia Phage Sephiroth]UDL15345.1 HNH endonuclease [Gordonia phage Kudefre]
MGIHKGRSGRPYRTKRARYRRKCAAEKRPCSLCGKPIDYTLTGKHPMAWTLEHIIPVSELKRIDPNHRLLEAESNFEAAHMLCNQRKQDGGYRAKGGAGPAPAASSRRWT